MLAIPIRWGDQTLETLLLQPHEIERARRVCLLLFGIVLLSLADLVLTITHLRTIGMLEANPIASFLISSTQSWVTLSVYKIMTVGTCVLLLYQARRHYSCEIASWFGIMVLAGISVTWHLYTIEMEQPEIMQMLQSGGICEQWLLLD